MVSRGMAMQCAAWHTKPKAPLEQTKQEEEFGATRGPAMHGAATLDKPKAPLEQLKQEEEFGASRR